MTQVQVRDTALFFGKHLALGSEIKELQILKFNWEYHDDSHLFSWEANWNVSPLPRFT